ncbi:MAG: ComF family protein [Desulfobacterales bacterium]|nr:ComF family protein [Desulfobacterales bacterium]
MGKNKWQINCLFIKKIFALIVDLFFPLKCLKCQKIILKIDQNYQIGDQVCKSYSKDLFGKYFCQDCITLSYELFEPPFCKRCGKKFEHKFIKNHFCEDCLKISNSFRKVRAGARYSGIIKESIQLFKYQKKLALVDPLGKIIFSGFVEYFKPSEIDVIMPVPLHISKLKQRGFNQAFLVVKNFKKMLEKNNIFLPMNIDLYSLKRVKKTDPQTNYSVLQRKENVKNAFKVVISEKIKNKRILLVDDVYTTGATSSEAARKLLEAGALTVDVLVIARV